MLHILFALLVLPDLTKASLGQLDRNIREVQSETLSRSNNLLRNHISKVLSLDGLRDCSAVVVSRNGANIENLSISSALSLLYAPSVVFADASDSTLPGTPSNYIRRTKRFLSSCAVVVADLRADNVEKVHSLLTEPVLFPLTIRNEDFYLFVTLPSETISLLLADKISFEFKHKIELVTSTTGIIMKTTCLACDHGKPSVIEVSKSSANSRKSLFPDFLRNLQGKLMRAVVFSGGYSSQLRCHEGGLCAPFKTGGVALRAFLTAGEHFNYTSKMWPSKSGGRKHRNGTWIGITGDILYGRADFGLVNAINLGRMTAVDLSYIIQYVKVAFVHIPPDVIYSWKSIFWPLNPTLWTCIGIATLTALVFLHYLNQFSRDHYGEHAWSLTQTIEFLFSSFLCQVPVDPVILPVKVFASCWYMFIIIITTLYLSKMFDIFVSPPMEKAPNDFRELAESDFDIHMTYYGGAITEYFRNSANGTSNKKIYNKWKPQTILGCHIIALKTTKSVCISWDGATELAINMEFGDKHGRTNLIMKPSNDLEFHLSIAMQKRWGFSESFNRVVSTLVECGFLDLWKHATFTELRSERFEKERLNGTSTSTYHESDEYKALNVKHLTGAFVLIQVGLTLAFIVFLGDIYVNLYHSAGNAEFMESIRLKRVSFLYESTLRSKQGFDSIFGFLKPKDLNKIDEKQQEWKK